MLEEYWPSTVEIECCIRTEAEELAEHVLLAVHEPVFLEKRQPGESAGEHVTEKDLLDQLLLIARPIPIIGESGIGKSHLIRWLDAKLRVHPDAANWHIRRIPKNAGLRSVLERLLENLEGSEFKEIRERIANVGDHLSTKQVADYLIVGMGHSLDKLYEGMQEQLGRLRAIRKEPDAETAQRLKLLERHVRSDKLPVLLNDPFFNSFLKHPEKGCIYQIAKRLTGQSDAAEIGRNEYRIRENDLNFDLNIGDLSLDARNYVNQASLNTQEQRREEVTNLLNEVINDACRETFYHFFQFNSGSFQELFESIRRQLHTQGKTLVLLIEDMAAISAIEDVLVDSLITEGIRDGVELLCPIRSAIAVTEGYAGYQKRRNTLATRAQYEWYLPNRSPDDQETLVRIENFCGRYLNAARIGEKRLKETYRPEIQDVDWPGIWEAHDLEDPELLFSFGCTEEGIPLFPFNKNSIWALSNEYCTHHGEIVFNPRTVLHHLLRYILLNYCDAFEEGRFPPGQIGRIECPGQLASELSAESLGDSAQLETFAAVWGWGADTLAELASTLPVGTARAFRLDALALLLEKQIKGGYVSPKPLPEPKGKQKQKTLPQPGERPKTESVSVSRQVDEWFKDKAIPQKEANLIRTSLVEQIEAYAKSMLRWWGVVSLPPLTTSRNLKLVHIAYNANNPTGNIVANFGGDKEFSKETVRYKGVITAILRRARHDSWSSYPEGYEDYCRYRNYLSEWLPQQISGVIGREREASSIALSKHASLAVILEPRIEKMSSIEKLAVLVQSSSVLSEDIKPTGLEDWDKLVENTIEKWPDVQEQWLQWFTPGIKSKDRGRRGLEGDLVFQKHAKLKVDMPRDVRQVVSQTRKSLFNIYSVIFDLLEGCSTKDEFNGIFSDVKLAIEQLKSEDQYKSMPEGNWTSRQFLNRLEKLGDEHWVSVKALLSLINADENFAMIRNIRLTDLDQVKNILVNWSVLYDNNYLRVREENLAAGADARTDKRSKMTDLLEQYANQLGLTTVEENND